MDLNNNIFIFQKGFNYSQDGPGNRLVYHLCGCNLKCPWCSNPEGLEINEKAEKLSVESIVKEALSCRMMFIDGGGVTLTGGEVTCQKSAVLNLLKTLKKNNIHTCIETNGTSPGLLELLEYIDYLIMDFKHYDSDVLREFTGVGNENIKLNFERNCRAGRQQHIRIPLINGFNADCPEKFAEYFSAH
ncbi:MAG: radical SAM protein, partial [Clostridia bacterium]|nr:radical SAM protein [Clostridia bacterium]